MELEELEIELFDEGMLDPTDSQSLPLWGRVKFPQELLEYLNEYKTTKNFIYDKKTGKPILIHNAKSSVWTAFDKYLYERHGKIPEDELPKISAIFKSCFNKYGAVVENMAMKIAVMLDMPTSYNYIVKFDKNKHPEIIDTYPTPEKANKLYPYGIVSIDFLQSKYGYEKISRADFDIKDENGNIINSYEIDSVDNTAGDELIQFDDALKKYNIATNSLSHEGNLIENWVKVVDELARRELAGAPQENINKYISHIHSRIARSFLLKDLILGDCDFTARNGGLVINRERKKLRYAPNYDYGQSFNNLIRKALDKSTSYYGMTKEQFDSLPDFLQRKLIEQNKNKKQSYSMKEIAEQPSSAESERNLNYVFTHFPTACKEFFENLDEVMRNDFIGDLVDTYNNLTVNGEPLLTEEECKLFKEYIYLRASHAMELYANYLVSNDLDIPSLSY